MMGKTFMGSSSGGEESTGTVSHGEAISMMTTSPLAETATAWVQFNLPRIMLTSCWDCPHPKYEPTKPSVKDKA